MSLPDTCTRWGDELVLATFAPEIPGRTENEAYALANPGDEYTVYFTCDGDRRVSINLTFATGSPTETWLNILGSRWTPARTIESGKAHILSCPDSGQWVVVLK
jgi:hypothetical protein